MLPFTRGTGQPPKLHDSNVGPSVQRTTSQAYVLWSDHAKVPVQGREYRYIGENEWRETVYSFDGGAIESSVGRLDVRELHDQAGVRPNA